MLTVGGIIRKRTNQSSLTKPRYRNLGGVVYFALMLSPSPDHPIKVGNTQRPKSRWSSMKSHSPYPVEMLGALLVPDGIECKRFETEVRARLVAQKEKRLEGEWFDIHPEYLSQWINQIAKILQTKVISPQEIKENWL